MKLQELRKKNIIIWGAGRDGVSALGQIQKIFPTKKILIFTDKEVPPELRAVLQSQGCVEFVCGNHIVENLSRSDVVIKSPGISLYRDDIKSAAKKGVQFLSTTNLWFAEIGDKNIIAVTGTKGKSTTVSIIYHCLKNFGVSVEICGNIGKPLLNYLDKHHNTDTYIVELSSYQTADIAYTPKIGILVNLFPEHIDWHKSLDNYYKDKLRLFNPDHHHHTILNYKDKVTRDLTASWNEIQFFEKDDVIHSRENEIYFGKKNLGRINNVHLQGEHNISNICAALTGIEAAGYDPIKCYDYLDNFVGLPHRQEVLGTRDGLLFVDDSISTTPETAMAAINRFWGPPITILLGGFDRKQNYGALANFLCLKQIHMVITLPNNGYRIAEVVRKEIERIGAGPELIEAVDLPSAVQAARKYTPPGGIVLLSPAAPSYGIFDSFEERGKIFRKLFKLLI
jgi:UDP-N-acetylmuramoylalanine--D-glutamate ligase